MLIKVSVGIIVVMLLHCFLLFLVSARSGTIKRMLKWIALVFLLGVVLLLLRFGFAHLAAIVSALAVFVQLYQLFGVKGRGKSVAGENNIGLMSEQEARDILGVGENASAKEIRMAYKSLMQKLHPDHGGSEYLAAKLNQAKDVLLKRKR